MTAKSKHNADKTHCKWGHPFSVENTRMGVNQNGNPKRRCKTCSRESAATYAKYKRRPRKRA